MNKSEKIAEIKNKIQPSLTSLEKLAKGDKVSIELIKLSLESLNHAVNLLKDLDGGYLA